MLRRRQFITAIGGSASFGFACMIIPTAAKAMSEQVAPEHLRLGAPRPDGSLDWELLAQAGEKAIHDGVVSRFPAEVRALDGKEIVITGYMMPFKDGPKHREFLLGQLEFHCSGCMAGDLNRLMAVKASRPVSYDEGTVTIRGQLRLLEDEQSPLFYRLDSARAI